MTEQILSFFADFMTALSNCSLYSGDHASVLGCSESAVKTAGELFVDDHLSIMILGDSVTINNEPFTGRSLHVTNFMKKMRRRGIDKVVFTRGLSADELKVFISELSSSDKLPGQHQHIETGVVEIRLGSGGIDVGAVMEENRQRVKDVYTGVSRFRQLDMVGLEDVVLSFISTLRQEANVLRVVSPVKSHSEYTYTHNTNVAVLSIFQAEALGIKSGVVHDIGLAGLLHDVGKMFVAREVLEKNAQLDAKEWQEMRKHPQYGAIYLAELDVPRCAVIAAFEHHMKFNGSGYPDTKRKSRRQHIISQIISIADFFDALRTERPYRRAMDVPKIISLMKEGAGKDFNPVLVENFLQSMRRVAGIIS